MVCRSADEVQSNYVNFRVLSVVAGTLLVTQSRDIIFIVTDA